MSSFFTKNKSLIALIVVILLMQVVEISSFIRSLGKLGVIVWYSLILFLIIQTSIDLIYIYRATLKKKAYFTLASFLIVPLVLIVLYAGQPANLSLESTQQLACALNNFSLEDWGFFQNCFLGYPARQFYLPLIPSALNQSIFSIHIGNLSYFLIGWVIFINSAIRRLAIDRRSVDLMLTIILFLPLHFYYFNYLTLQFEQAGYALGIGLAMIGLLIRLSSEFNYKDLILLTFFGYIAIGGYTTPLAYLPLVAFLLSLIVIQKPINKKNLVLGVTVVLSWITSAIVSVTYRDDIRFGQNNTIETQENLLSPLLTIFNLHESSSYVSEFGLILWMVLLLGMLTFRFKSLGIILLTWIIGVFGFSILTAGYASPDTTFALYRSMIIIPPILGLLVYQKINFFDEKLLIIFAIVIATGGLYYQYQEFERKSENKSIVLNEMYNKINLHTDLNISTILLLDLDREPYLPIKDGVGYFLDGKELSFIGDLCDLSLDQSSSIITTQSLEGYNCFDQFGESIIYLNSFKIDTNGDTFFVYEYHQNQ